MTLELVGPTEVRTLSLAHILTISTHLQGSIPKYPFGPFLHPYASPSITFFFFFAPVACSGPAKFFNYERRQVSFE